MSCTAIAKCTWLIRPLQRLLRHAEHRAEVGRFLHQREVVGRQRLQREAALAALQRELVLASTLSVTVWSAGIERRMSISLRAPTVVAKLPPSPPSSAVGAHLDLEVAGRELDLRRRSCGSARWPGSAGYAGARRCPRPPARRSAIFLALLSRQSCQPLNLVVVVEHGACLWTTRIFACSDQALSVAANACGREAWLRGRREAQQLRRGAPSPVDSTAACSGSCPHGCCLTGVGSRCRHVSP